MLYYQSNNQNFPAKQPEQQLPKSAVNYQQDNPEKTGKSLLHKCRRINQPGRQSRKNREITITGT